MDSDLSASGKLLRSIYNRSVVCRMDKIPRRCPLSRHSTIRLTPRLLSGSYHHCLLGVAVLTLSPRDAHMHVYMHVRIHSHTTHSIPVVCTCAQSYPQSRHDDDDNGRPDACHYHHCDSCGNKVIVIHSCEGCRVRLGRLPVEGRDTLFFLPTFVKMRTW